MTPLERECATLVLCGDKLRDHLTVLLSDDTAAAIADTIIGLDAIEAAIGFWEYNTRMWERAGDHTERRT